MLDNTEFKVEDKNDAVTIDLLLGDDVGSLDMVKILEGPLLESSTDVVQSSFAAESIDLPDFQLYNEHRYWKSFMSPQAKRGSLYPYIPLNILNRYDNCQTLLPFHIP